MVEVNVKERELQSLPSLLSILTFLWSVSVGLHHPCPVRGTGPGLGGRCGRSWLSGRAGCVLESGGERGSSSCGPAPTEPGASCTKCTCQTSRARVQWMKHSGAEGQKITLTVQALVRTHSLYCCMSNYSNLFNKMTKNSNCVVNKKQQIRCNS